MKQKNDRLLCLKHEFLKEYNCEPTMFFSSPGRVEILGNHTDHQHGKVLVGAIDLDILAAVKPNENKVITVNSIEYSTDVINIDDLSIREEDASNTSGLIRGVVKGFIDRGYHVGGFDAVITSNIYAGAGLSSSAAYELLICVILNKLYNDDKIDRVELAKISQFAENVYFQKPCGLLDQMGIALGGVNFVDFEDSEKPEIHNITFDLKEYGIVLVNTGGSHAGLTKYYASIKEDLKNVCHYFQKNFLREVDEKDFIENLDKVFKKHGGRAMNRALHIYDENKRVEKGYHAIENKDTKLFLDMINASGQSSYDLLQNCFIEKDKRQGIAFGVNLTKRLISDGAVRVHGGGFKGTIIAYVNKNELTNYVKTMKKVFGSKNVHVVSLRSTGATYLEQ